MGVVRRLLPALFVVDGQQCGYLILGLRPGVPNSFNISSVARKKNCPVGKFGRSLAGGTTLMVPLMMMKMTFQKAVAENLELARAKEFCFWCCTPAKVNIIYYEARSVRMFL